MSSISLTSNGLNGDFELLFDDETVGGNAVAGMRMLRRASGATATVHTTQALYSAVADKTDEFLAMGFKNPMTPTTPNAFVMENGYFIPRSSTEFLKEGAVSADWSTGDDDEVRSIAYTVTTNFVAGDVGRQVVGSITGDTGTLLDFELLPDGVTWIAWIRPDATTDTFQNTAEVISVTVDGGTGSNTTTAVSTGGTQLYSSIQVIGAVPAATEVYLYQDRFKMTDSLGAFQWWVTDTTVSLGIVDILIRVLRDGVSIADGDVEVFGRRYTSLYDQFRLNVAAGGRSALPLASSPDGNNTTGYRSTSWASGTGTAMQVGDLLTNTTVSGSFVVVTAVVDSGATGTFEYYVVGQDIDLVNTNTFTSPNRNGTINSAPVANLGGPTDPAAGEGGTVTIALGHTTIDHDGNGSVEPYSITVDAQGDVSAAKVYERLKYVTRRGADATDLFGAGVNILGESYRGLEVLAFYDTPTGVFTEGDDVTGAGGYTSRVISVNTVPAGEGADQAYVMMADQQTSLDVLANNDTLTDEASDTVIVDTAGAGGAIQQFTVSKQSPLGTFTGTQIFGTRGVAFINPGAGDAQNYILIDDLGTPRTPPNTVTILVQNTAAGDRILYARDTGTPGVIDKDQFGGVATGVLGATTLTVTGSVDVEVPPAGTLRVVDNANQEEHRYRYASRTTGASGIFTLVVPTSDSGTITTASSTQIIDLGQLFSTGGTPVEVGDMVRNTFAGKTTHVWEVTNVVSDTVLDVQVLYGPGGATQDWDIGDTYEINKLIGEHTTPGNYTAADDLYDTIIDEEATGGTVSNTLVKTPAADFGSVANVRQGKVILTFSQDSTVGDTGDTVTTVRTPDTIAT